MYRTIALVSALLLAVAAFAACSGGGDSSTTTATVTASASASAGASASPASSATDTTAPSQTPVPTATPILGNWTVAGQLAGPALLGASQCQDIEGRFDIQLRGNLSSATIGILISAAPSGTLDFSQVSATTVAVQTAPAGSPNHLSYWFGTSGDAGMSGTATIEADGSGSLELTVPASVAAPGGATEPITVSGPWLCP